MRLPSDTDNFLKARSASRLSGRACKAALQAMGATSLLLLCVVAAAATASHADEIETEHLFGFTTGTDVGSVGEREFEGSTTARLAKRSGNYSAASQMFSAEFVPLPNLRTEYSATFVAHDISGVSGFDNRRQLAIGGFSADFRYQLLDRTSAPFGFAIGAEPHWSRIEDVSGASVREYGADFVAAFDKEIVPDRIVAAFNVLYQPEVSRSKTTGTWSQESTSGIAAAAMAQISPGVFFGLEGRYLRHYDSIGFDTFDGHAAFLGPTLYVKLSQRAWVAAAWSAQIAGHAIGTPGSLDLVHFERHQVRFLFGLNF